MNLGNSWTATQGSAKYRERPKSGEKAAHWKEN